MLHEPAQISAGVVDHDVFIVHVDDDAPFVNGELVPMLGLPDDRVILSSELPFPAFTEQAIAASVERSRLTLAVISPAYLRDRWAGFAELLSRNVRDDGRGGTLVPLLLADCDVPTALAQHQRLDCRTPQQRAVSAARIRERLGRPEPRVEPIACPYPGMRPFTATAAARFHGRAAEIDELIGRLHAGERDIYVIGPSGSGKSSLIAAGVIPRLVAAGTSSGRFAVRTVRPGERPMQRLAESLACEPGGVDGGVAPLLAREGCERLLVFVDQLEELFTLADADERRRFVRALGALRADPRCHQLVALRADFYGALMSSALWSEIDGRCTELKVAPLRGEALREAITAPARQVGVYLEAELVDRLIDDAAAEPGALPLLQEALVLLWERRSHRLLRLASYEALGSDGRSGLAIALARRADAVLHDLDRPQQRLAQRIFLRLVSFGDDRPDTRRPQRRAALVASGDDAADVEAVVDRLIEARLLTSDATAAGEPFVDLAHEALITGWPTLQRWLLARRDDEQRRRVLELHAAEWAKRGRGGVGLFDAVELGEAERWIAAETARELGYSDDLTQFLAASRAAIDDAARREQRARRWRRRLVRFVVAGLALFSVIVSVLGLSVWRERNATRIQLGLNEQERARSLLVEGHDAGAAIPHLLRAIDLGVDNAVLRTLLAEARHGVWRFAVRAGRVAGTAAFSPDGSRIVTTGDDGTARVWDTTTGAAIGGPLVHDGPVTSAAFSPDGSRIVTVSSDGTARVWDAATGAASAGPLQHAPAIVSVAFSSDGSRVVTASGDGTARIWNATTGAAIGGPLAHDGPVTSAAFSPDGTRIVTVGNDTARIWDAATDTAVAGPVRHGGTVRSAAFSPDGTRVVAVGNDTARIWDTATGIAVASPVAHDWDIRSAAFSPDGTRVVTASAGHTARIWNAVTGAAIAGPLEHDDVVTDAAFSPDGTRVVTASADHTARIWDAATGVAIGGPLNHLRAVTTAAFSPDGTRVVTASWDYTVRIWDATTGAAIAGLFRHDDGFTSAAFSHDGAHVITASGEGTIRIWNVASGAAMAAVRRRYRVTATAFSPDRSRGLLVSVDGTVRVWDGATGAAIAVLVTHDDRITDAAFSPDGLRVVTTSANGAARVWDVATGAALAGPFTHHKGVNSAAFSPDGLRVVTASSDGTARVWEVATGAAIAGALTHDKGVNSAAFSPDGLRVVTASSDGTVRVWDAATGMATAGPFKCDPGIRRAVFSPDGSRIATATVEIARVWDATTGVAITGPLKYDGPVWTVAFSPDGTRIVTGSMDGTARVWDVAGAAVTGPLRHGDRVTSAGFSPDGTRVVTAGDDHAVRIWDAAIGAVLADHPVPGDTALHGLTFSQDGSRVLAIGDDGLHVWSVRETGSLSRWAEQARRCVVPEVRAVGVVAPCPLEDHETAPGALLARARSMMIAGDAVAFAPVHRATRTVYQRAAELLAANHDALARADQTDREDLHRALSTRLAMLDAVEGHLPDARAHLGDTAAADADLLDHLARIAHEDLGNDAIALPLLVRAHDLAPQQVDISLNLAEAYVAAGRYADFARTTTSLDQLTVTPDRRVVMAALVWAVAHLTGDTGDAQRTRLVEAYRELTDGTKIGWIWTGTKRVLTYGRVHYAAAKPVLDVLELLERPVTEDTRRELVRLLQQTTGKGP